MVSIPRVILFLLGAAFLGFGTAFVVWPSRMARLVDIALPTRTALADFTATYGGFQLGFGVFLLVCAQRGAWLEPGLWAAAAALGGFGTIRVVSLLLTRGPVRQVVWIGLLLELGGVALSIWGLGHIR
jgi:hypothetical protein